MCEVVGVGGGGEALDDGGWSVKITGSCNLTTPSGLTALMPLHPRGTFTTIHFTCLEQRYESVYASLPMHPADCKRENKYKQAFHFVVYSSSYHDDFCQVSSYSDLVRWQFISASVQNLWCCVVAIMGTNYHVF